MSEPVSPDPASRSSASLGRASALMASGTLVSRILGLVRTALLVSLVGTGLPGDAWETANTLPNTIYILLAGGILNVVFVPQLTRALAREDRGRDLTDRLITLALSALVVTTVLVTTGGWLVTKLYAIEWSGAQLSLAVAFAYLCLPQVFFYGVYALLGQILNAQEKFGWYMWAPVANNVVAIAGLVVFRFRYPDARLLDPDGWRPEMILLLGGTATLGVVVQALVLLPPVRASGFRYRPRWGFRGVGLGSASRMAMWTLAIIAVSQLGLLLSTNTLNWNAQTHQGVPGKIVYGTAFLIFILPHSLIATSLLTAMFPALSRAAMTDDRTVLGEQYRHGLRLLGTAMVPISVAVLLLAPQLVGVLLVFTGEGATDDIAWVVRALTLGLAPYGMYLLSQRVFHAYQEGAPPFRLQTVITGIAVLSLGVAVLLPPPVVAITIGVGQSLGQILAAALAVRWVRRRLGAAHVPLADVRATYLRAFAASVIAALPVIGIVALSGRVVEGKSEDLVVLILGGALFFLMYGVLAHLLGVRELAEVLAPLLRRLRRRRAPTAPSGQTRSSAYRAADAERSLTPLPFVSSPPPTADREEPTVRGIDTGTVLGERYALEELLARRDDTLDYWSATDQTLERLVAVTVLPATGEFEDMAHAVLDGARRTAGVDDPRLVRVLDVGIDDGYCWIVEEGLSEAESLASLVAEHPLPAEEARRLVGETASGLESARRRGLHHLYLNPHAVLRTSEGSIKVSGIGVAAAIEQVDDVTPDEASLIDTNDLLALLYTGLTGRWPGEQIEGLRPARRLADGTLPAPSEVVSGVPGDLDALCRMSFGAEYSPEQGLRTPGDLARQLAPWPSELVQGTGGQDHGPDSPLEGPDAGAALAGGAGAGAAISSGWTGGTATPDSGGEDSGAGPTGHSAGSIPADATTVVDPAYYRTEGAAAGAAAVFGGEGPRDQDEGSTAVSAPAASRPAERRQSGIVLALIAAILAVAVFLAYGAFQGLRPGTEPGGQAAPGSSASPGAEETDGSGAPAAGADDDQQSEQPAEGTQAPDGPIEPVGITSYDPEGDGDEHNDTVDRAIDGNPETAWNSRTYLAPNWANLKSGVGLLVDLGEPTEVSEVSVSFPQGDYDFEVYVTDEASREDGTSIGSMEDATGTQTITAEQPATGRYVLIWISRAWTGPRGEIVYVSEVTVK